jgi:hypothetical protein
MSAGEPRRGVSKRPSSSARGWVAAQGAFSFVSSFGSGFVCSIARSIPRGFRFPLVRFGDRGETGTPTNTGICRWRCVKCRGWVFRCGVWCGVADRRQLALRGEGPGVLADRPRTVGDPRAHEIGRSPDGATPRARSTRPGIPHEPKKGGPDRQGGGHDLAVNGRGHVRTAHPPLTRGLAGRGLAALRGGRGCATHSKNKPARSNSEFRGSGFPSNALKES